MGSTERALLVAAASFLAGCGCKVGDYEARDADAVAGNERSVTAALARAGLTRVPLQILENTPARITEPPTVTTTLEGVTVPAGKSVLFVPSFDSRVIVRDRAGKLYTLTITHEVKETRRGSVCGCYPGASGTPQLDFPGYAIVDATDTYSGSKTVVARGWIDLAYDYPDAAGEGCRLP